MYKVSLGQYLRQNFMNRPFHNASLIFFGTVSKAQSLVMFKIEPYLAEIANYKDF